MSETQTPEGHPIELPLDADAGPAHYITRAKADAIILRALDEAGFGATDLPLAPLAAPPAAAGTASLRPRRRWSVGWLVAAAAILCATVGSASAAVLWYARVRVPGPVATTPTPRGERVRVSRRAPAPPSAPLEPTVTPIAPVEAPLPAQVAAPKPAKRAPEDWLNEGNRLRAEKRWGSADEAYSRAVHGAPHSPSAYVAQVASAAVRLEHLHDARGALARYRAALKQHPSGSLREEIHFGIADAYRALGDRAAEREALALFLREHPGSALAAQARARLDR